MHNSIHTKAFVKEYLELVDPDMIQFISSELNNFITIYDLDNADKLNLHKSKSAENKDEDINLKTILSELQAIRKENQSMKKENQSMKMELSTIKATFHNTNSYINNTRSNNNNSHLNNYTSKNSLGGGIDYTTAPRNPRSPQKLRSNQFQARADTKSSPPMRKNSRSPTRRNSRSPTRKLNSVQQQNISNFNNHKRQGTSASNSSRAQA